MRERVCLACEWRRRCGGDSRSRGAHGGAASSSPALWEHHRFGPGRRGPQLSEGRDRRGQGGGGRERGRRGGGQRAPRLALSRPERRGHVAGRGGAALKRVGVGGSALAVPKQAGVEGTGWLRGSSSSSAAATHAFQLLQCVQDYVGGVCVFGCTLSVCLGEVTQDRAHCSLHVLQHPEEAHKKSDEGRHHSPQNCPITVKTNALVASRQFNNLLLELSG